MVGSDRFADTCDRIVRIRAHSKGRPTLQEESDAGRCGTGVSRGEGPQSRRNSPVLSSPLYEHRMDCTTTRNRSSVRKPCSRPGNWTRSRASMTRLGFRARGTPRRHCCDAPSGFGCRTTLVDRTAKQTPDRDPRGRPEVESSDLSRRSSRCRRLARSEASGGEAGVEDAAVKASSPAEFVPLLDRPLKNGHSLLSRLR